MAYQRKPGGYGADKPQEKPEPATAPAAEADKKADEFPPERIAEVMQWAAANPEKADLERYDRAAFAGPGRRLFAYLVDCLIVMPTMLLAAWALGTLPGVYDASAESVGWFGLSPRVARIVSSAVQLLLYDTYFTSTVYHWGGTWGQKFLGLVVLRRDLARPTKKQARWRYWALALTLIPLGLGALAITWDRHRRGWHDRMVGTYAVRMTHVPGELAAVMSLRTRDPSDTAQEFKTSQNCLMYTILLVFAPGLIVLGLLRLLLGKMGVVGKKKA